MGISSAGIGSGLDVDGIISKLMTVEAAPLATYDKKAAAYQAKLDALGKLGSAIGAFQGSLSPLSSTATFRALNASASNADVIVPSVTTDAVAGSYSVNVTQLAQAQSLSSKGMPSTTATLGAGVPTTLTFHFGTVAAGTFGVSGSTLGAGIASGGIANGSLTINGKAIATDAATTSAKALAAAINAQSAASGVSASAAGTASAATLFAGYGNVDTSAGGTYALSVNGIELGAQGAGTAAGAGLSAAALDTALTGPNATTNALAAANITMTGSAVNGDLRFFAADGSNLAITETVTGTVDGGIGHSTGANAGSNTVATSAVTLTSTGGSPVTVGGANPSLAGLSAGSSGSYSGAGFTQDGTQASGIVTLDAGNQSLQGIRDAINKAGIGVTASIVSDGSAAPYHLVLTSTKTGEASSMKISLAAVGGGAADASLTGLLGYDPAGAQALTQTSAAQSTRLTVNGIAVASASNSVTGAIQGVTLAVGSVGTSSVVVAKDSSTVKNGVNAFVKAYNDLNTTIKGLTSYDATTKRGGALLGDSGALSIQTRLRQALGRAVDGLDGKLTTLSGVGIAFQKDGSLAVDTAKLQKAITENFADIGGLFSALGTASDSLVSFTGSSAATKAGTYPLSITAIASKGSLTSDAALAPSTTIDPNTSWSVTLNQTDPASSTRVANVALAAGTYTPSQLSALLRAAINGNAAFAGNGSTVETSIDASGKLVLASSKFGSVSNIDLASVSGTTVASLFGAATAVKGTDVAGTLAGKIVTGSGQTLTGAAGSPAEGLKLLIDGGALGERGAVTFSQGYAYQLSNLAGSFVGTGGLIAGRADGLNASIKSVATARTAFSDKLGDIEKRYRTQYSALDTMLASMQSTQSYLTQQLAAIAKNTY